MIKLLEDWMLLELVKDQEAMIHLPENVDPTKGDAAIFEVIDVGPGYQHEHIARMFVLPPVSTGDCVLIAGFSLSRFKYKGENKVIARARDVVLVIKEE